MSVFLVDQYHRCQLVGVEHLLIAIVAIWTSMPTNGVVVIILSIQSVCRKVIQIHVIENP